MRLPLKIATRFLKSSKGQTILIVLGIAIGVSVQIFIGSLIQGLQKSLVNKTIGNSSQITVVSSKDDKRISDWESKMDKIKTADTRITKISAAADQSAFLKYNDKNSAVLVRGFNLEQADKIYDIKSRVYEGKMPLEKNEIIIGKELAKELSLKIGDEVSILTQAKTETSVTIVGLYDLKVSNINKTWVITNLATADGIFSLDNKVTSIEMQVDEKNIFVADEIALNVEKVVNKDEVTVQNWKVQNEQLLSGLKGQSVSSLMIQVFVLVSVVLGIASVLAITVVQKSKQIGILKAMGIKNRTSSAIFMLQGLILGVLGAIVGVAFGLLLAVSFTKFAVNPDGTPVVALYISYKFIGISALIAIASATLASLIPARNSSKLEPMEVIKNG